MAISSITSHRLQNQCLVPAKLKTPEEIVSWFGAMQAQDYLSAKWAIGVRLPKSTNATIEKAISGKTIVRSWAMRGTLHFMAAKDISWILDLLAPGVLSRSKSRFKQLELDEATFLKAGKIISKILVDKPLKREEIFTALRDGGISTEGQRGIHILYHASLNKLICHGGLQGKQFTFALFDQWITRSSELKKEDALSELALRYFKSHGPATLQDFIWWTGFSVSQARSAIASIKNSIQEEIIEGQTYWLDPDTKPISHSSTQLLPAFDEYIIGYRDRSTCLDPKHFGQVMSKNGIFYPTLEIDGKIVGTWKRSIKKDRVLIETAPFSTLNSNELQQLETAAKHYGDFWGMKVEVK